MACGGEAERSVRREGGRSLQERRRRVYWARTSAASASAAQPSSRMAPTMAPRIGPHMARKPPPTGGPACKMARVPPPSAAIAWSEGSGSG